MIQEDIYNTLNGICRDVFVRDDINLNSSTTAVDINGWDSFRHIELMSVIEVHFGIQFHSRELDEMRTVGDLVRFIESHLQSV